MTAPLSVAEAVESLREDARRCAAPQGFRRRANQPPLIIVVDYLALKTVLDHVEGGSR